MTPLRVDPALLGLPPVADTASASAAATAQRQASVSLPLAGTPPAVSSVPPAVAASGPRDDDEVPDASPALVLRAAQGMVPLPKDSAEPRPAFLSAQRISGLVDREVVAEGDAELRKVGTVLDADRMTYWPIDDEIEAEGNVRLAQNEDLVTGPKMRLKIEAEVGYFNQPTYTLKRQPRAGTQAAADKAFAESAAGQQVGSGWFSSGFATPRLLAIRPGQTTFKESTKPVRTMTQAYGHAERIDFEGENKVRLTDATYTTCTPDDVDWYARTSELRLDYDREVAEGRNGTIYFKDVPILYTPWLSFSLNRERKSGFLSPTFGTSTDSGLEFTQPYYWNIAPNMDATISPRLMTKRGMQVNNEFRYLNTAYGGLYQGKASVDVLPGDKLRDGDNRYAVSLQHLQTMANGLTGQINYNKVSDDRYFTDLSSSIAKTSLVNLTQQAMFSYGRGWWDASANVLNYQTLQPDPKNPNPEPYRTLPQLSFNARSYDLFKTDVLFMGQYTNFVKPGQTLAGVKLQGPDGQRTVLYPQISLPYVKPGWYITPKLGLNVRHYALAGQAPAVPDTLTSTLPIASVDAGMVFERASNWFGKDYVQTLEPRLYYLNIPYRNQDNIPIFDTGLADFNFAQIFSENQFVGWDRINNANQLTAVATTRLIEPSSGNEIMRAMLGQRFYFTRNRVSLSGTAVSTEDDKWDKSDMLAAFSGQILPRVYLDTALQYTPSEQRLQRYSIGARFQPEPGKVLNAAYRYNNVVGSSIDQVDLSGQWPLSGRWHAVGRINYSFKDDASNQASSAQGGRMVESIAGLEYNGGCWVVRGVVQRSALTADKASTAFFIQLELTDFSRIGSSPLNLLKRNIQGYSLINQTPADPVFGE